MNVDPRQEAKKYNALMTLILVVATYFIVNNATPYIAKWPRAIYYTVLIIPAILQIFFVSNVVWSTPLFFLACALSILGNTIEDVFRPWERLFGLIVLIVAFGPFFRSSFSCLLRARLQKWITMTIVIMTWLSLVTYWLRMPFALAKAGLLNGLFSHSMLLGPISGIVILTGIYKLQNRAKRLFWMPTIAVGVLTLLLAASRGAFVATICGVLAYLVFLFRRAKAKLAKYLLPVVFLAIVTAPILAQYGEVMHEKQQANLAAGTTLASRESLWQTRIKEFRHSPIIGCGFSSLKFANKEIDEQRGIIEPGSSWLYILSATGLTGGIFFFALYFRPFFVYFRNPSPQSSAYYFLSILVLFGVHFFVEGYVLSAGSFLCIYFWLVLACAEDARYEMFRPKKRIIYARPELR